MVGISFSHAAAGSFHVRVWIDDGSIFSIWFVSMQFSRIGDSPDWIGGGDGGIPACSAFDIETNDSLRKGLIWNININVDIV